MTPSKAVLVLSGKGGVGKSLISANLALALMDGGAKVGLLDADFSASNSGYFIDMGEGKVKAGIDRFEPLNVDGLEVFSFPLVYGEQSVSMEGSQYGQLLRDAIQETSWTCDYLVVDLPAGFGDELKVAARVLQNIYAGSIIVLQPAHYLDGIRAITLHRDLEMPILGLIENMSYVEAGAVKLPIFGDSIVDELGAKYEVPVFGKIPLSMKIRKAVESKNPRLPEKYLEPVLLAVESFIAAPIQKPGFLTRIKTWLEGQMIEWMVQLALNANKQIDIFKLQKQFGYPGGRVIRLNIIKETGETVTHADWIINNGKLTVAEGEYDLHIQIDITPNAIKWAFLKNRALYDGHIYSFEDALRLGHMKVYGEKSMVQGAYFMRNVFESLSNNPEAMTTMKPLLEGL